MSKVLLENVGKTFDGKKMVLNDFSLQIDDGDFVVLIGPSGCGKTTILNIIAGLECPTTGNVYIDDALSNSVEPKDRDVAMVFQNHALYPHLSVYKNLAFPLKLRKYSKKDIEKEVFFIANLLNIAELLNRKPNQLSGGQQQRVAIGKALIRNPSLFLMDEPLSSLDAELKILLRTEIKELHSKLKSTFVYVTHDQSEAMSLSTKLVVIKDGIIQQTGTPYEVFIRPTNKFVASFIGQHKINFFDLDVVGSKIYFGKSIIEISKIFNVKTISIGIRPEDFVLDSNGSIALSITNIEILGNEMLVTGKFGERFAASVILPTDINIKNGDIVTLSIRSVYKELHADRETGC